MEMTLSELGSEFWLDEDTPVELPEDIVIPKWLQDPNTSSLLLLSGRTAIDFILSDIEKERSIHSVYMPSYCCNSMLVPFLKRGVEIRYYDVVYDSQVGIKLNIDVNVVCDILFVLDYFGFITNALDLVAYFESKGSIIIEDNTHSIFTKKSINKFVHYSFVSLRKWFEILSGAVVFKHTDFLDKKVLHAPLYVSLKHDAMKLKYRYLMNIGRVEKNTFLSLFSRFNQNLSSDYCNYGIDTLSSYILNNININHVKEIRKENAFFLYRKLSEIRCVEPIFKDITEDICPLFVPVLVRNGLRDKLVSFLRSRQIYCPIHWSASSDVRLNNDTNILYNNELSLLCDQRYNLDQMGTILSALIEFDNKIF